MAFYKTVIQVEVLTEDPYGWNRLGEVAHDIMFGHASGLVSEVSREEITEEQLVEECAKHATDPTFFTGLAEETFMDERW
jgi:hypothetical protein